MEYVLSVSTERLNDRHPDRIRFFLSKADTAGVESDRQVGISTVLGESALHIHVGHTCTSRSVQAHGVYQVIL